MTHEAIDARSADRARCGRSFASNGRRWLFAGLITAMACAATPALAQISYPAQMPATPMPEMKGCSNTQEAFLKRAWRRAHYFTWRADRVAAYVRSRPAAERAALWSRDLTDSSTSSALRRWFGPYDADRAAFVAEALGKAERRFEMRGSAVKGIRTLRCGSPIAPPRNEHTDVCPAHNVGSSGAPSAYHAPVGTIVTCPAFWDAVNNNFVDPEVRLNDAARRLVHEAFHWLSVNAKYVVDYHADGAGGMKDDKYYGVDKSTTLAEHKPSWAIRNNDNYAFFARAVGLAAPTYSALFAPKDPGGTGGLFVGMTWDALVGKWKTLRTHQYLADVESYVIGGKRRYLAVWREGAGNGALYANDWAHFSKTWTDLKKTQDLIDIETWGSGAGRRYLGVWRLRPAGRHGDGGLLAGLSWDQLVMQWQSQGKVAHLSDVETYVEHDSRRYVGVWQVDGGGSTLLQQTDWTAFAHTMQDLHDTQRMLDYESYRDPDGRAHYIGVWRDGGASGPLFRGMSYDAFIAKWNALQDSNTLIDVEVHVPLAAEIE